MRPVREREPAREIAREEVERREHERTHDEQLEARNALTAREYRADHVLHEDEREDHVDEQRVLGFALVRQQQREAPDADDHEERSDQRDHIIRRIALCANCHDE